MLNFRYIYIMHKTLYTFQSLATYIFLHIKNSDYIH